jgi:large repetitive protein
MKKFNSLQSIIILSCLAIATCSWQNSKANTYDTGEMGFETGTTAGWTTAGSVLITGTFTIGAGGNQWTVHPADNYMARVSPSGSTPTRNQTSDTLTFSPTAFSEYNSCFFASNTTNYAYIYRDISMTAGQTITMYWNYVSQDYCPYNDGVFATFTLAGGLQREIKALAATCIDCGIDDIIVTGSYGSTDWYSVTFTAISTGVYRLGFGAFNHQDTAYEPILAIDNAPGGTSAPGFPVLTTSTPTNITSTSATGGGNVTSAGGTGQIISERGIVYSTTPGPVIGGPNVTQISEGSGLGAFTVEMTGLAIGQTYYVRAYAINEPSGKTGYGGDRVFTTVISVFNLSGGGEYCHTTYNTGMPAQLDGSQEAVMYQLYRNGNLYGPAVDGSGEFLQWDNLIAGTYTALAQSGNSSIWMNGSVEVIELPLPVFDCPDYGSFCEGDDFFVFVETGTFLDEDGNQVAGFEPLIQGSYDFVYTETNEFGCSDSCNFTIMVHPLPTLNCQQNIQICINEPVVDLALSGFIPSGGVFDGVGVDEYGIFDPEIAGLGVHTLTYQYTNVFGCSSYCEFNIIVNGVPMISCPFDFSVCCNDPSFILDVGSPSGGTYTGDYVSYSGGNYIFNPTCDVTGDFVITYTFTDDNGCINFCSFIITVFDNPEITCPGNFVFCIESPDIILDMASPPGGIYSGPGVADGIFSPIAAGVGEHSIEYFYIDENGCSNSCYFLISIYQPVAITNIDVDKDIICAGDQIQLLVEITDGCGDISIEWSSDPPGFYSTNPDPPANPEITTTYYVFVSDSVHTVIDSLAVTVFLNQPPGMVQNMLPINGTVLPQTQVTLSWQPATNAYLYDIFIWKASDPIPVVPVKANHAAIQYTYSNLSYATAYNWKIVAKNPCFETESETMSFSVTDLPDLIVTEIDVPEASLSGTTMNISYAITNIGLGETGWMHWSDRIYLSQNPVFDPDGSILAGTFQNVSFLEPEESYTKSAVISLDNYLEGQFYVFVVADVFNNIQETNEENNLLRSENPVEVIMSTFPDLLVRDVQAITNSVVPGSAFSVGWIVENIGEASAVGGWSQKVSILKGPDRRLLGFVQHTDSLAAAGILSQNATFNIPKTIGLDGDYYLEIHLIPNPGLIEMPGGEANNLVISIDSVLIEKKLFLTLSSPTIQENATQPVHCTVTRSGKRNDGLSINLEASEDNRILLPESVIIPAGQSGTTFAVYTIDNNVFEGNIELEIIANALDYSACTATLTVIDDEVSALLVNISKTEAFKGDTVVVSITREWTNNSPLGITIYNNKPDLCQIPANIAIEPGEATTTFDMKLLNNGIAELPQELEITAYSPGYVAGADTILVLDNNLPQIEFHIFPDTVSEAGGALAAWGTLSRVEPGDKPITLLLSATPANQIFFPPQVIIPANVMEKQFNIGVIDNTLLDGARNVEISATIYLASCNCGAPPEIGGVVNATLTILDNDGPSLSVYAEPFVVPEGIVNAGSLFISRNTPTGDELLVNIHNGDTTEIELPSSVIIPAGQTTVEVPFNTIDDGIEDGNQYVTITVSADDFNSGGCWVMVTDRNFPDLVISDIAIAADSIYVGQQSPIELVINNNGFATATPDVGISVYLSQNEILDENDAMISYFSTDSQVNIGCSIIVHDTLELDGFVGSYYLIAVVNEFKQINELIYINNQSGAVPITILPDYYAVASVDGDVFNGKTPITINGFVKTQDNFPAPDKDVDVYVIVNGTRRVLKTVSNEAGNFSVNFQPLNGEAGHFIVGACFPGLGLTDEQDTFIVTGMKYIGEPLQWDVLVDQPIQGSLQVKNFSGIPLNSVYIDVISMPQNCEIIFDPVGYLPGNATIEVNYTLTGIQPTDGLSYEDIKLRINSAEGSDFNFTAKYHCKTPAGYIKADPVSFVATMVKGQSNIWEFEIQNIGLGETGLVSISIPSAEWMTLICPDTISTIPPGASAVFTLQLTPTQNLPLNVPITGNFMIYCENANNLSVPFSIETISTSNGSLLVDVVNEYTYFTPGAPHVDSAHVILRHPYTGAIISEGLTDVNGHFLAENIPEGYYTLTVQAFKHESYQNTIFINQGQQNTELVFISFQAISYFWEVIPTLIEDEYEINLIVEYETNVPAPVILINMPDTMPHLEHGEQFPFIVTLTNVGLITAEDVELFLPENDAEYVFNTLFENMDILPNQSIQVPVVMERRNDADYKGDVVCFNKTLVGWRWECGPHTNYIWTQIKFNYEGRVCYGGSFSGGSFSGGGIIGGGGSSYTIPVINFNIGCHPCHIELSEILPLLNTSIGCLCIFIADLSYKAKLFCLAHSALNCLGYAIYQCALNPNLLRCAKEIGLCYNIVLQSKMVEISACLAGIAELCLVANRSNQYSFLEEAKIKTLLVKEEIEKAKDWSYEFLGDSAWFYCEEDEYITFFDYFESKDPENGILFNQELIDIKPSNISSEELEWFIDRWNNTVDMVNGFPYDTLNVIDLNAIEYYFQAVDSLETVSQSYGYGSTLDLWDDVGIILNDGLIENSNSICATVSLNFSQNLTMTREAFEGTLTLYNGHDADAIQNVMLSLEIRDEDGFLSNDLFQINTLQLDKLTGINGEGLLNALQTGKAVVQFIPTKNAAPTIPRYYSFGGTLSYLDPFTNETVSRPLFPVTLQVNPSPDLYLDYFMQRDILGDDALTPQIEPSIPAELAVMINNQGAGDALNVQLSSAQPEIIDNEKGLLIDFQIVGSNLSGQPMQLGLLDVNFGNIPAGEIAVGQWWFTSSLLGHFVSYEATVKHLDSYGNPDLSLIGGIQIHELIKSVYVYGEQDDGISDFLVNDIPDSEDLPDALYYSNGIVATVYQAAESETDGLVSPDNLEIELSVTPSSTGWNYTRLNDPGNGYYRIISCTREDGLVIPLDNIWLTHVTIPDGGEPIYENKMHFIDKFPSSMPYNYTVVFEMLPQDIPEVLAINGIPEGLIDYPLSNVQVVFNKPIDPETFNYEDMILNNQGGPNLMDSLVVVTQLNDTVYNVDISSKTWPNGYYTLTVHTSGVADPAGNYGQFGKQASWIQAFNIPAIQVFIGAPGPGGIPIDSLHVLFNMPLAENSFTEGQLILNILNGDTLNTNNLVVTKLNSLGNSYKIGGLYAMTNDYGTYVLTVKVTEIMGANGQYGMVDQSIQWTVLNTIFPIVYAGPDATICNGESYQITGAFTDSPYFYWIGGDGVFEGAQPLNPVYVPGPNDILNGSVELCLIATSGSGFDIGVDCMMLTIEPLPDVTCPESFSVEIGQLPFLLTGAAPPGGIYTGIGVSSNMFYPAIAGIGVHEIQYAYTSVNGCAGSCVFDITVIPAVIPVLAVEPSALNFGQVNVNQCSVLSYQLSGYNLAAEVMITAPTGFQISTGESGSFSDWIVIEAPDGTVAETIFVKFCPIEEQTYQGNITNNSDTLAVTVSVTGNGYMNYYTITTLAEPFEAGVTTGDGVYPEGAEILISATENYGWEFVHWTESDTILSTSPVVQITVFGDRNLVANFIPDQIIEVYAGPDATICEGESYFLEYAFTNSPWFYWYGSGDGYFEGMGMQLNPVYVPGPNDILTGSVELCLTATSEWGIPVGMDCMILKFYLLPDIVISGETAICDGEFTILTATAGVTYLWSTGETTQSIVVTEPGEYSVTVTDENGCVGSAEVTVTVFPLPLLECPQDMELFVNDMPLLLEGAIPAGGYYVGLGVFFDGVDYYFDPSIGVGNFEVSYCYLDQVSGCENCCMFMIMVSPIQGSGHLINIPANWSIISSYYQPFNPDLYYIFETMINQNSMYIMLNQNGFFWPSQNINTLGDWNVYDGYKVKMNEPGYIEIYGEMPISKLLSLNKGINYLPVLCDLALPSSAIFDQIGGHLLFAFDLYNQLIYWPGGMIYTLQQLQPGTGYLVGVLEPVEVVYNCAKDGVSDFTRTLPKEYNNSPWRYNQTGSIHLISLLSDALKEFNSGDYVGVFNTNDVCVGFAKIDESSSNQLLVAYGNDFVSHDIDGLLESEVMRFKIYLTSSEKMIDVEAVFDQSMPNPYSLFVDNGLSAIKEFKLLPTGIEPIVNWQTVMIIPNPAKDEFTLVLPGGDFEKGLLKIYRVDGQFVKQESITEVQSKVDISKLNSGVFILSIEIDGNTFTKRLIKH